MKLRKSIIFSILTLSFSNLAFSQYYKTLPKGARTIVFRNVTTEVDSSYNHSQSETPFSFEVNADIKMIESIDNDVVNLILETLKPYPKAYEKLDLGTYKVEASAEIEVDGYGFAYGITNRLTAYGILPTFTADVRMKYSRPKGNNYEEVINSLSEYTSNLFTKIVVGILYALAVTKNRSTNSNLVSG
jgi:hypothetical protein